MYSQRNEEEFILKLAPTTGRYLDVGAYHATTFSNTRALYERGWSGVLIEPSPDCFCGLMKAYENDPRIKLVNALATADSDALTKFYTSTDAVSTSEEANRAIWAPHVKFTEIYVPAIPINKIIASLGIKADFVSIDTEGSSFEILRVLNLDALGCNLICVETDQHAGPMATWLDARGFELVTRTSENIIAKRVR